jgi:hypothetical protein
MRNLSTNLENPGKSCPVVAPQKTDTSKSCNCLFKKLTKWCNSDQDGSFIPQCLQKLKICFKISTRAVMHKILFNVL